MSKSTLSEALKKIQEINKVVSSLDPAIKLQAFEFLCTHYFDSDEQKGSSDKTNEDSAEHLSDNAEAFFTSFSHDQPSDNVFLVVAWLYSRYGVFPLTRKNVTELAEQAGLTIPGRPDMTMSAAKHEGKKLFTKRDKAFQLTVHGEAYLKKTYKVKKGILPLPEEQAK